MGTLDWIEGLEKTTEETIVVDSVEVVVGDNTEEKATTRIDTKVEDTKVEDSRVEDLKEGILDTKEGILDTKEGIPDGTIVPILGEAEISSKMDVEGFIVVVEEHLGVLVGVQELII